MRRRDARGGVKSEEGRVVGGWQEERNEGKHEINKSKPLD